MLAASLAWNVYVGTTLNEKVDAAAQRMDESRVQLSKGIIMMDIMGRAITVVPTKLNVASTEFKRGISNYIRLYGLYTWGKVSNNFQVPIRTLDDFYANSEEAVIFRDNYLEKNSKAYNDFEAYLTSMVFGMNKNTLVEFYSITDQSIEDFRTDGDSFSIRISYKVVASIFDGNTESYRQREGNMIVEAIGKVDPSKGSPINPLGITFTELYKPTNLTK